MYSIPDQEENKVTIATISALYSRVTYVTLVT